MRMRLRLTSLLVLNTIFQLQTVELAIAEDGMTQ